VARSHHRPGHSIQPGRTSSSEQVATSMSAMDSADLPQEDAAQPNTFSNRMLWISLLIWMTVFLGLSLTVWLDLIIGVFRH
jgi:hypothetical protein